MASVASSPPEPTAAASLRFERALLGVDRLAARAALDVDGPLRVRLDEIVVPALDRIGAAWERGAIALSQVYMAGRIAEELIAALTPPRESQAAPRVALTLLEDHHQLGKRMVASMLAAAGHDVADLGRTTVDELVQHVEARRFEVVLISVLMLASARRVKEVAERTAARAACARLERGEAAAGDVDALRALEQEVDLPFLQENLPQALGHAEKGLDRISSIVRAMREFAHPSTDDHAAFDLNRALQATAEVARHEYKYVADLEWGLGEVPQAWGNLAEVNQALVNVLVNAAQAVEDVVKDTGRRGRITLRTWREGDFVVAAIGDTGPGIAPAAQEHLFEQFFTTKEIGRGTGQGLSIAWRIVVERHRGALTFETKEGVGTTFFIKLPIAPA